MAPKFELPVGDTPVRALIALAGAVIVGAAGWYLGRQISITLAFIVAAAGIVAGVYFGWKWGSRNTAEPD